jgi:hypothetical protein
MRINKKEVRMANYMVALWLHQKAITEKVSDFVELAEDVRLSQENWSKFWKLINYGN